jgi:hypothetical protein
MILLLWFLPNIGSDAGCNWYLRDINIYSLYKNSDIGSSISVIPYSLNEEIRDDICLLDSPFPSLLSQQPNTCLIVVVLWCKTMWRDGDGYAGYFLLETSSRPLYK